MKESLKVIVEKLSSLEQTIEVRGALIAAEKLSNAISVLPEEEVVDKEPEVKPEIKEVKSNKK